MDEIDARAKNALNWGIGTWVANAAGCLVGMVPIALPLSIFMTIATLFTGIGAMVLGARARTTAKSRGDDESARYASWGFWLGAAHIGFVVFLGIASVLGWFLYMEGMI